MHRTQILSFYPMVAINLNQIDRVNLSLKIIKYFDGPFFKEYARK